VVPFGGTALHDGAIRSCEQVFPYDIRRAMRYAQLCFVKLFGLKKVEGDIAVDVSTFANAILNGRQHPNLYLTFGPAPSDMDRRVMAAGVMSRLRC
jgi:hypothetical protein